MANGNGSKWGMGFNQWLKVNWLMLCMVVAATTWAVRLDFRVGQMESDVTEMRSLMGRLVELKAAKSKQTTTFQTDVVDWVDDHKRVHRYPRTIKLAGKGVR